MRILTIHPGPEWSVADVHRGWTAAFEELGHDVVEFPTASLVKFYENAHLPEGEGEGEWRQAFPERLDQGRIVSRHIEQYAYEHWPDVVFVTYLSWIDPHVLRVLRRRGHTVVACHTEAPYEDGRKIDWARHGVADLWLINDPTNLEQWRAAWPQVYYVPHSHDPRWHRPSPEPMKPSHDVCFIGSSFPSRVEWFTRFVEAAPDLDIVLAGNWRSVGNGHPLQRYSPHEFGECLDNTEAAGLYWRSKVGLNMYRREADDGASADGWAMGPREVEMAACGLFFLTEERGENRQVLPMLPTFESPEDAADQARWWATHATARDKAAIAARHAVQDWTFKRRAEILLDLLDELDTAETRSRQQLELQGGVT